jgi:hypothetical protein
LNGLAEQVKVDRTVTKFKTAADVFTYQAELFELLKHEVDQAVMMPLSKFSEKQFYISKIRKLISQYDMMLKTNLAVVLVAINEEHTASKTTVSGTTLLDDAPLTAK